jgi:hypothetical protein
VDWLARYERFWSPALDRLVAYAEAEEARAVEAADARAREGGE